MINITINGKKLERKFQNMAQALAFAYQNGECYGAEVVELALEGKGYKSDGTGVAGAFTQADIDNACEKTKEELLVTFATQLEAKDAEIAELKEQLKNLLADINDNKLLEQVVETEGDSNGGTDGEPVTEQTETPEPVVNPAGGSEPVEEAGVDNTAQT
jgi:hypothetical protein